MRLCWSWITLIVEQEPGRVGVLKPHLITLGNSPPLRARRARKTIQIGEAIAGTRPESHNKTLVTTRPTLRCGTIPRGAGKSL